MCIIPDTPPVSTLPVPHRFAFLLHSHVAETGSLETGLVNFLPPAVASEPTPPLIQPAVESDSGVVVVNLLAAEALIARHERRTGQSAASTVVWAGVIVVGHSVTLSCCCVCILTDTPLVSSPPDTLTGQCPCTEVNRFGPHPQFPILVGWFGGCLSLVLVHHGFRLVNVGQVGTLCPVDALVDFLSCDLCCHCPSHVYPFVVPYTYLDA